MAITRALKKKKTARATKSPQMTTTTTTQSAKNLIANSCLDEIMGFFLLCFLCVITQVWTSVINPAFFLCGSARRGCLCRPRSRLDCRSSMQLHQLPNLKRTEFKEVLLSDSSLASLSCRHLPPDLQLLDIRNTLVPIAEVCRFLEECQNFLDSITFMADIVSCKLS